MDHPSPTDLEAGQLAAEVARQISHLTDGVLAGLLSAYRQQGYGEGYHRAISEVLTALVAITERYLGRQQAPEELRAILYNFIEHMDKSIRELSTQQAFVEGGLGI